MADSEPPLLPAADDVARPLLDGKRVLFLGKLGSMTRRDVRSYVRDRGGVVVREDDVEVDWVVIGAEELPTSYRDLIPRPLQVSAAAGEVEIVTETEWWQRLGEVGDEGQSRQLYTPAMLADLVGVPLSVIRRWHRRGLIVPVREVHRLPYFDFREVATARHLARLLAAGVAPASLERELAQLARFVPEIERPIAQLAIMAEGRQLLLRRGEGLIDADGQRRFDFEFAENAAEDEVLTTTEQGESCPAALQDPGDTELPALPFLAGDITAEGQDTEGQDNAEYWLQQAMATEDGGQLAVAVEMYRAVQIMTGPNAEWSFRIAELLYRLGDVTGARERYYMAIELDEDYVEARANLGCVLAELGQSELAVAAFQGALVKHPDYPDVRYHLARTLDELGQADAAVAHWRRFLELAPESPWADDARERLGGGGLY